MEEINGTSDIDRLVCAIPAFCAAHEYREDNPTTVAFALNKALKPIGYRLRGNPSTIAGFSASGFLFESVDTGLIDIPTSSIPDFPAVRDNMHKAINRIELEDYAGAISTSYTLVETLLKGLLGRYNISFNESEGDIQVLYNSVATHMNLNPAGKNIESYIKGYLQGIKGQIAGLYHIANKAGDRHAGEFVADAHHARLVVNGAFALCVFLLESYQYQQNREERRAS